jgi:hypothetical protein
MTMSTDDADGIIYLNSTLGLNIMVFAAVRDNFKIYL